MWPMVVFMVTGYHKRLLDNGTWVVLSSGESTVERWNGANLKGQWKQNLASPGCAKGAVLALVCLSITEE